MSSSARMEEAPRKSCREAFIRSTSGSTLRRPRGVTAFGGESGFIGVTGTVAGAELLKKLGTGVEETGGVGVAGGGGAGLSKNEGIFAGAGSFAFDGSDGVEGVPKLKVGTGGFGGAVSGFWKNEGTARPPVDGGSFGGGGFETGAGSGTGVGVAVANPFVAVGPNAEPFAAGAGAFWNALPEAKALLGPNALPDENALPCPLPKADLAPVDDGKALDEEGADGAGAGVSIFFGW